jgi:hypothetical protein
MMQSATPWLASWTVPRRKTEYATCRLDIARLLIEQQIRVDLRSETKRLATRTAKDVKDLINHSRHLARLYCKGD